MIPSDLVIYVLLAIAMAGEIVCTYLLRGVYAAAPQVYGRSWMMRSAVFFSLLAGAALADPRLAILILARTLLSASASAGRLWWPRAVGAQSYAEVLGQAVQRGSFRAALLGLAASAGLLAVFGGVLCFLGSDAQSGLVRWAGFGVIFYSVQLFAGSYQFYARVYRTPAPE